MDNTPVTSVNSELISAGLNPNDPSHTAVDFANSMAKNQQEQAAQEQAIARATELAKQAKLETADQEEAADEGYNKTLADTMTPEAAILAVKGALAAKKITGVDDQIDAWGEQLKKDGRPVAKSVVEEFVSRFAKPSVHENVPTPVKKAMPIIVPQGSSAADIGLTDMHDADGNPVPAETESDGKFTAHVPADGMYSTEVSNDGEVKRYVLAGKEAVDPSIKADAKQKNIDNKRWSDLEKEVQKVIASQRGNQLSSAVFRATRAINELADTNKPLGPQVVSFIGKDLSGIFQGGVPTVSGSESEDFSTSFDAINRLIQKYTGNFVLNLKNAMFGSDKDDSDASRRQTLIALVTRLRDSSLEVLEAMIKSTYTGYRDIIDADPANFNKMVVDKINAAGAGTTSAASTAMNAATDFPNQAAHRGQAPATTAPAAPAASNDPLNVRKPKP